jgi:hypothetical protein
MKKISTIFAFEFAVLSGVATHDGVNHMFALFLG